MKQKTLALKKKQINTFDNFVIGANQKVIHALQHLEAGTPLYLFSNYGDGVTHLLEATCHYWQQKNYRCCYIDLAHQPQSWGMLLSLIENNHLIVVDNLESGLGDPKKEEILFHLFNRSVQTPFNLVWGAHRPYEQLSVNLPDLLSRLSSCLALQITPLNDGEKELLLKNYAQRFGFTLKAALAKYLIRHYSRSWSDQITLLEKLDEVSLEQQKKLTIPFLKSIIKMHQQK